MEQSFQPTDYVIVRAGTKHQSDPCNFVLLHLTPPWLFIMRQRLAVVAPFRSDNSFYSQVYWDEPLGYYVSQPGSRTESLLAQMASDLDAWAYVTVADPDELALLDQPKNLLETHMLMINSLGDASYLCFAKEKGEEYATESFSLKHVVKIRG